MQQITNESFLRLRDVINRVKLSRTQIYGLGQGRFPAPIKLSARASAWTESCITNWINDRVAASHKAA